MSILDKFGKRKVCTSAPQTSCSNLFNNLCDFYPSQVTSPELYRSLREAVPVIDTAIYKEIIKILHNALKHVHGNSL